MGAGSSRALGPSAGPTLAPRPLPPKWGAGGGTTPEPVRGLGPSLAWERCAPPGCWTLGDPEGAGPGPALGWTFGGATVFGSTRAGSGVARPLGRWTGGEASWPHSDATTSAPPGMGRPYPASELRCGRPLLEALRYHAAMRCVLSLAVGMALALASVPDRALASPGASQPSERERPRPTSKVARDWMISLPPDAVLTFVGEPVPVLLVATGPATQTRDAAAAVLRAALEGSALIPEVLGPELLGDTTQLGHGEILERAGVIQRDHGGRIARILIIQVEAHGGPARDEVLYVDSYFPDGRRYAGFALTRGTVLSPHWDPRPSPRAREQIFEPAWEATTAATLGAHDVLDRERRYLDARLDASLGDAGVRRGLAQTPLEGEALLEALALEGLDAQVERRRRAQPVLIGVGFGLGVPLLVAATLGVVTDGGQTPRYAVLSALGFGLGLGFQAMAIVGIGMRPAYEEADLEAEVERHNRRLRADLGLAETIEADLRERSLSRLRPSWSVGLAPLPAPGDDGPALAGVGVQVGGRF